MFCWFFGLEVVGRFLEHGGGEVFIVGGGHCCVDVGRMSCGDL